MEHSLDKSTLQTVEIKNEIFESFEFEVEKCPDLNKVKQEPYDDNELEPIKVLAVPKIKQEVDFMDKCNGLTFSTQIVNDETYYENIQHSQIDYVNCPLKVEPNKVVTDQVELSESKQIGNKSLFPRTSSKQYQSTVPLRRKPYPCHLCKRSYSEMNILFMHQTVVHGHNQPLNYYYTKYCKSTLLMPKNCNDLRLNHESLGLQNSLHSCVVCNRTFSSTKDLNYHTNFSIIHKVHVLVQRYK